MDNGYDSLKMDFVVTYTRKCISTCWSYIICKRWSISLGKDRNRV